MAKANVVVAFKGKKTDELYVGLPHEQHADLRVREKLGLKTEGWLVDGFFDRDADEFITRTEAAKRFPEETGRTLGLGTADSSDFDCINDARRNR